MPRASSRQSCVRLPMVKAASPPRSSDFVRKSSEASGCFRTIGSPTTRRARSWRQRRRNSRSTGPSSMRSAASDYVESLSPWPEEFGLERMRRLLASLGDPQLRYPSIHVVGTNGKSTTTRMLEALLSSEGLDVGAYTSPHVGGWGERIRVGGGRADFDRAIERVRGAAEAVGATQFEVVTAAALAEFAEQQVDA